MGGSARCRASLAPDRLVADRSGGRYGERDDCPGVDDHWIVQSATNQW